MTGPQVKFWQSPAKFRAFVGGIGSGKSFAGCVEILRQPAGSVGMVTAPTYPMLRDATLSTFLDLTRPYGLLAEYRKQEMRARLVNGTTVLFRTADDPERLRGPNLAWWYGDEASLCDRMLYQIMRGRLRLDPGKGWLTFTPKGKGWLYDEFVTRATPDHYLVHATTDSNTFLPDGFVSGLLGTYSDMFARQELGGEWIDESDDRLIPDAWLDRAFAALRAGDPARPAIAVDLSKGTGRDRTVVMVGDDLGLLALEADSSIALSSAASLVKRLSQQWGVPHDRITYDAGGWAGPDFGRYLEELGILDAVPYRGGASGRTRFANKRSRAGWSLRQRLTPDRPRPVIEDSAPQPVASLAEQRRSSALRAQAPPTHLHPPPFAFPAEVVGQHADDLRRELAELRYHYDGAKIALEIKDALTARLGHSPDLADTLLMLASILESDDLY